MKKSRAGRRKVPEDSVSLLEFMLNMTQLKPDTKTPRSAKRSAKRINKSAQPRGEL
jgi:hypothetical protein